MFGGRVCVYILIYVLWLIAFIESLLCCRPCGKFCICSISFNSENHSNNNACDYLRLTNEEHEAKSDVHALGHAVGKWLSWRPHGNRCPRSEPLSAGKFGVARFWGRWKLFLLLFLKECIEQSFEGLRSKYKGVLILTKPFGKPVKDFIQISEGRRHRVTVFIVCYLLNAMGYFTEAREP